MSSLIQIVKDITKGDSEGWLSMYVEWQGNSKFLDIQLHLCLFQIEHSEQVNLATSVTLQQKDSVISDQEVRLRQLNLDLSQTEAERDRLKAKVDELKESMRSLSSVNSGLESTILARDAAVSLWHFFIFNAKT